MGKQRNVYFIGRQENIVYYQWKGGYYMRTKSSLTGKRFWQDPAFAGSRKRAVAFGEAAKLAAEVYQLLPKERRKRGVIGQLTGLAHRELIQGKSREEVVVILKVVCGLQPPTAVSSPQAGCTAGYTWKKRVALQHALLDKKTRPLTAAEKVLHKAGIYVYLPTYLHAPRE